MDSQGSVYQRKRDGHWIGKIKLPPDPLTGISKYKEVTSSLPGRKGEQEAKRKLHDLIEEIESGNFYNSKKMTVEGFLKTWLKNHKEGISETTYQGYRIYIENHIYPILGRILINDLKPMQAESFYTKELKTYSAKTVLQEHRILHKAFKDALKNGIVKSNIFDLVTVPSPEKPKLKIPSENNFGLLLDAAENTKWEIPILLAGMCGLRRGEVLGLDWSNIDFENGTINIVQTAVVADKHIITKPPKSETSTRLFKIPSEIIPILKKKKGIGLVVPGKGLMPMHGGSFSKRFAEFLKANNLTHIRFHDLRHFNATMMLKYGVSDAESAFRLGHSDPSVTKKIYQHVLEEMDTDACDKLNSVFKNKGELGVKIGVKQ